MSARVSSLPFDRHPLAKLVQPSTVVAVLTRSEYATTDQLNEALEIIEARLTARGVDSRRIGSAEDVVAEFALNAYVHGQTPGHREDWIVIWS